MNRFAPLRWQLMIGLFIALLSLNACVGQSNDNPPTQVTSPPESPTPSLSPTSHPTLAAVITNVPLVHVQNQQATPLQEPTSPPIVLLPTITPSPTQTATALPTDPVAFLLPTVTPTPLVMASLITDFAWSTDIHAPRSYAFEKPAYYDDQGFIVRSGITYVEASQWEANGQETSLCPGRIETEQSAVTQGDACFVIALDNGGRVIFQDIDATSNSVIYRYLKPIPELNSHLLQTGYWEGGAYLLVHQAAGVVTPLQSEPYLSPDQRYLALARFGQMSPNLLHLEIWQFKENIPHFLSGWRIFNLPSESFNPSAMLTWESPERLQVEWAIDTMQSKRLQVTASQKQEVPNSWQLTLNNHPLPKGLIEYDSIRFALGAIDNLVDILTVGKPSYIDQPYAFVTVPQELEGATYFRIPQYYFVGESRDYYPESVQKGHYLRFRVLEDVNVYVALDAQLHEPPDWLQGWQAVEINLENDDIALQLYHKAFPARSWVELVDSWMEKGRAPSQFIVMVTPQTSE